MQTFEQKSFFFAVFYQINMSKNNIIYHWVMYHLGIYLTIWLFGIYIYPFLQVAAQVQGVKTKLWYKHISCTCANPPRIKNTRFSKSGGTGAEEKKKFKDTKNSLRPCIYTTRYKYQGTKYKVPNTMYQCVLLFQNRATKIVPFFRPGF